MIGDDLRARSRQFAIDVVMLCIEIGDGDVPHVIKPQLLRSATGTAANYRAACRCRSSREFASRLAVSTEEADEAELWLDILDTVGLGPKPKVKRLRGEAVELRAIFSRSRSTALENAAKRRDVRNAE
jgi:four helix bundle protein